MGARRARGLIGQLRDQAAKDGFEATAAWRSALPAAPLPLRLVDHVAQILRPDRFEAQYLARRRAAGTARRSSSPQVSVAPRYLLVAKQVIFYEAVNDHELASTLRLVVARLARRMRRHAVGGLTPSQYSVLASLDRTGPVRASELAKVEGMAPPTLSRVLAHLDALELLARDVDPADGRASLLTTSGPGRGVLSATRKERTALLADSLAALDADQRRTIADALPALDALIERMDRPGGGT